MTDSKAYEIPQQSPRQDSLSDQMKEVHLAATRLGCYDAADWIWKNAMKDQRRDR